MGQPLVSIIVTLYNYEKYIDECIASCLRQTHDNLEIIVVDDCSTDSSLDVVSCFHGDHKNVKIISFEHNHGYAHAKNAGIRKSKGEFIVLVDADDVLLPTGIALRLNGFAGSPEVDLVHGLALRWYGGNDTRGYNKKTYVHAQGRMYRRSVYDRFGGYYEGLRSMSDKEYVYRLGVHPDSPLPRLVKDKKIKTPVALYRKHEDQMHKVRRENPKRNSKIKKMFKTRIKQLKREGITRENTRFL